MTKQQQQQARALLVSIVPTDKAQGVAWAINRGIIKDSEVNAFLCRYFYNIELEKTKKEGRKYGDKKQAIAEVQKHIPLSERRILSLIK